MTELDMKEPEKGKRREPGKGHAIFWAIVFIAVLALAVVWMLTSPEDRGRWREQAADMVDNWTKDTPVTGLGSLIREKPERLPETILKPQTDEGTLSGRQVSGLVGSPVEVGDRQISPSAINAHEMIERLTAAPDVPVFSPDPLPPVTEDREVKPDYLSRVADWLAARYRTGEAGGSLAMNIQALNNFCGVTLAGDARGGRQGLLRYAFHPAMVEGLYKLYIDRFMAELDRAARHRGLDENQNRSFHRAVAGKALLVASSLEGAMAVPDLGKRLEAIDSISQKVVELNGQLGSAVAELDSLRGENASASQISTTQMRVDGLAARYRRAMGEYADAQRKLAGEIRQHAGSALDDDSLLFISAWIERRLGHEGGAKNTLQTCVSVLRDLARRCNQPAGADTP